MEWFRKAISVNEKSLTAIAKAGAACVSLSKFDEALSYFKKIYEMQPDSGDNAFNVGTVYFFQGNYAKALELYSEAEMKEGKDLISLLVDTKIAKNRSEGRRLIEQNGISVNGVKVTDVKAAFSSNDFDSDGELIIQKGKKVFHRIITG